MKSFVLVKAMSFHAESVTQEHISNRQPVAHRQAHLTHSLWRFFSAQICEFRWSLLLLLQNEIFDCVCILYLRCHRIEPVNQLTDVQLLWPSFRYWNTNDVLRDCLWQVHENVTVNAVLPTIDNSTDAEAAKEKYTRLQAWFTFRSNSDTFKIYINTQLSSRTHIRAQVIYSLNETTKRVRTDIDQNCRTKKATKDWL